MCMNVLYRLSMMILRELDQMRSRLAAVDQMEVVLVGILGVRKLSTD